MQACIGTCCHERTSHTWFPASVPRGPSLGGAGGKYKELEDSIFAKADEDSWPPMKTEHPDYDRDLGRWDVYGDLTWTMDDILTIAVGALHIRRERFG